MNPLIVIGFDGMTWNVADKINLPNLDDLIARGGRSRLSSTNPPVTCPAWPSYLTGKSPSTHKAYDFSYLNNSGEVELTDYNDIASPTLIDVMNQTNVPSIFFEIPLTYPAPEGKAIVVSGYPSEINSEKFSPESLKEELENEYGDFLPVSPTRYTGYNQETVENKFFETTEYRMKSFRKLLNTHEWKFATINFHLSDQFAHYFWDKFEAAPNNNPLSQAYKKLDSVLGEILETIPSDTNVMIMSDHGQGPQKSTVNLNYFLLKEGFLHIKSNFVSTVKKGLMKAGITPGKIKKILDTLNLTQLLSFLGREKRDDILDKFLSYDDVDWKKTEAFAFGHMGQIYWIGESEKRFREFKQLLLSQQNSEGLSIDQLIELRNDNKPSFNQPKWLVKMSNWSEISYPLLMGNWTLKQAPNYSGCHRPEGILAWKGPFFNSASVEDPHLIDLAPTIHRLLELPPQYDFDGRVLDEILNQNAPDQQEPEKYSRGQAMSSSDDNEQRIEQLENLGYL